MQKHSFVLGTTLADVQNLSYHNDEIVVLSADTDVSSICRKTYNVSYQPEIKGMELGDMKTFSRPASYVVRAIPPSYTRYVREVMREGVELGEESVIIISQGKHASERTAIHVAASDLGLDIHCKKTGDNFTVSLSGKRKSKTPVYLDGVIDNKGKPTVVEFDTTNFSSFRSRVYQWAKRNGYNVKVQAIPGETNKCMITCVEGGNAKVGGKEFKDFLSTIPEGYKVKLPEQFKGMSDNYIRVMLSHHEGKFSYRGNEKTIRRHPSTNGPHIDSNGNFHYLGTDYGQRPPAFIRLKLRNDTSDAAQALLEYLDNE